MKRKLLAALLVVVIGVSMVACGNNGSSENESGDGTSEETTLTMMISTDVSAAGIEAVCALAKEKIGINVEFEYKPTGVEGDNLMKTRLASGDMTDLVFYNSGALLSALNPSEYFIDLSDNAVIMDRLDENYISAVTIDGYTYGVPGLSSQVGAVMYNKDIYEKYQLEVPETWSDFITNCKVLKEAGENAVIGSFAEDWTSQIVFLGDNANVLKKDPDFPTKLTAGEDTYAENPNALRSFEKAVELNEYYNTDFLSTSYEDACEMLYNEKGAQWICLTQALTNIYDLYGSNDNIGVFAIPADEKEDTTLTTWMPTSFYGNKNSDKTDEIVRFMEFYISDEALDAYASALLPDGPFCVKGYEMSDNAYPAVSEDMQAYYDNGKTGLAMEFITDIKGANCPAICQEAGSGQTTAEEAAKKYDSDCKLQAQQLGYDWAQ
ncbi:MAG: ABC transporter substrate-binding protein [Suipraeoptans sp.]